MAKTGAERIKEFRIRKKNDDNFKTKEKNRKQKFREGLNKSTKSRYNEQAKLRMRKMRKNKKKEQECASQEISMTPTSLGKAISRINPSLPKSPRKKKQVIRALAIKENIIIPSNTIKKVTLTQFRISLETDDVETFYRREDISRQAPGMKDVVVIRSNGIKTKVQKRHMYYKLQTAHRMYTEETGSTISFSKFANLRPVDVQLLRNIPLDVCLCSYHENFISYTSALFPDDSYNNEWIQNNVVCQNPSSKCYLSECPVCSKRSRITEKLNRIQNDKDEYELYLWEQREDRIMKSKLTYSLEELKDLFLKKLPQFLQHHFVKRNQEKMFQSDKKKACSTHLVVQCDFSENYTCSYQQEVQSAHWKQSQVTVFTVCIWDGSEIKSYAIVSDNLIHDKTTAISYLCTAIDDAIQVGTSEISIWSDGPSSQFKNRFIVSILPDLKARYNLSKLTWNYFATSHGKGPVDGVGGSIKRTVRDAVMSRAMIVTNARHFYQASLMSTTSKIKCILFDDSLSISQLTSCFEMDDCSPVPGIKSFHMISTANDNTTFSKWSIDSTAVPLMLIDLTPNQTDHPVPNEDEYPGPGFCFCGDEVYTACPLCLVFLCFTHEDTVCHEHNPELSEVFPKISCGQFVKIKYCDRYYPAKVEKISEEGISCSCMELYSGSYWKWPSKKDIIICDEKEVTIIKPPVPLKRGYFPVDF